MSPLVNLKKRIFEISFKYNLGHIGSCLTAVEILYEIYLKKNKDDQVIVSSGHAGLAQYVCCEFFNGIDAELLLNKHGIHPNRDKISGIFCSTGSLGHGLPIGIGAAIANPLADVYCLISDGECAEGSIWESLSIIRELLITNIHVYVNINGYGAYRCIDTEYLTNKLKVFLPNDQLQIRYTNSNQYCLKGMDAHYHNLTKDEYASILY